MMDYIIGITALAIIYGIIIFVIVQRGEPVKPCPCHRHTKRPHDHSHDM